MLLTTATPEPQPPYRRTYKPSWTNTTTCSRGLAKQNIRLWTYHYNLMHVLTYSHRGRCHSISTPQLQKYLKELLDNDIIEGPLQGPLQAGTYVSNIVITAKRWSTEEIRVNLDLRQINKDIVMSHHPIPTLEDLRHEFRHSDTFSSLDANHMFFQWEVKEDKRKIFTFHTPWG